MTLLSRLPDGCRFDQINQVTFGYIIIEHVFSQFAKSFSVLPDVVEGAGERYLRGVRVVEGVCERSGGVGCALSRIIAAAVVVFGVSA